MGRILALDFGRKRIGIAVSDPLQIIASGLITVNQAEVIPFLQEYMAKEEVDELVLGHPRQMDNSDSDSMKDVRPFLNRMRKVFPELDIRMYDERFTTKIAQQSLIEGGARKKTRSNKELRDMMSATILLTSYLEYKKHKEQQQEQ